jgi:hypothetical protein
MSLAEFTTIATAMKPADYVDMGAPADPADPAALDYISDDDEDPIDYSITMTFAESYANTLKNHPK